MTALPIPPQQAILFEDEKLYICLASFPLTRGHTVIVWKDKVEDLHLLGLNEYEYLMDMVDVTRDALQKALGVEKVYIMYMDEIKQVHWHLVPRYNEQGMNILMHTPTETKDFSLGPIVAKALKDALNIF